MDILSYVLGLQAGKGNGGSSEKVLLAEQTFEGFALDSNYEAYIYSLVPAPYALTVGETYFVKWDGTVYECVAQDLSAMMAGMVAVGNLSPFGLSGNNEPFIINYVASSNGGGFLSFDTATSHTVKIYQKTSSSGGGSVEGVHFVTFMSEDGSTELYKRPVADGDDCADPVIRGLIAEPEKESTAQYNYTHVGWSASPNGALDSNILKAVTADKTVYANYAAVLRYYTVTYYDEDGTTVLKTESLAYGTTPSYSPGEKGDYLFDKWIPDVASVTGDVSYTAVWKLKPAFATASWEEIVSVAQSGNAASAFNVGDERTETITYADGTSEEITWVIANFAGKMGVNFNTEQVNMVIVAAHALSQKKAMWTANTGSSYYSNSLIHPYLNEEFFACLPEELQAGMLEVPVDMSNSAKAKCFLLNNVELGLATSSAYGSDNLALFTDAASRIRTLGASGSATEYWTRTYTHQSSWTVFNYVKTDGTSNATQERTLLKGVVPAFCI